MGFTVEKWKKLLLIYNPMSGREQTRKDLSYIVEIFCKAGFLPTVISTQKQGDVTEIIESIGEEYDLIVTCGGDGTANEMTNGLVRLENRPKCGYIPTGTVNDFANSLKIPTRTTDAATVITNQNFFNCDLCSFNGRIFNYVAGFGMFTNVSYVTPQESKNVWGKMAYFFEAVKRFAEYTPCHLEIEYEDQKIEGSYILGLVSNSEYIASIDFYGKKNIKMDDGVFEVIMIKELKNPMEMQDVLNALISRNFHSNYILRFQTDYVKIHSKENMSWTLDGEDGGNVTDVEIKNIRRAIHIAVPMGNLSVAKHQPKQLEDINK